MSTVKAIYAGIRALGIEEEDDRRDLYQRVTGKRRLREMTPGDKDAVLDELRSLGFRNAAGKSQLVGPYGKKLQALWISAWNLGLTRSRDDQALIAFVRRQTGIAHTRWLRDPKEADKVVEALKSWTARAGVVWGHNQGQPWLRDHVAKVAWAQWQILHPDATFARDMGFEVQVHGTVGAPKHLGKVNTIEWRAVSNALGVQIRAMA